MGPVQKNQSTSIRIVRQDLRAAQASGIELKDVSDTDAHPTNARLTAALLRVGGDPLHRSTLQLIQQVTQFDQALTGHILQDLTERADP